MVPELRRAIYERDQGICGICAEPVPWEDLHVDHIQARGAGGTHAPANLRTTHKRCNRQKIADDKVTTRAARAAGIPRPLEIMQLRLDPGTAQRLVVLSRKLSIPRTDVIRLTVAKYAQLEGIRVPAEEAPNGAAESR